MRYIRIYVLITIFLSGFTVSAQQDGHDVDDIESIPEVSIPDKQIEANNKFIEVNKFIERVSNTDNIGNSILVIKQRVEKSITEFDSIDISTLNTSSLKKWDRVWQDYENDISVVYEPITQTTEEFIKYKNEINRLYQVWLQTSIDQKNRNIPQPLKESILETKKEARDLRTTLRELESVYISYKYDCNVLLNKITQKRDEIKTARENIVKNLLVAEQPVLWKSINTNSTDSLVNYENQYIKEASENVKTYLKTYPSVFYTSLVIFVFIFIVIIVLQKKLKEGISEEIIHENNVIDVMLHRPVLVTLLLTWLIVSLFFYLPIEVKSMVNIFMLLPLIIIINEVFGKQKIVVDIVFASYYIFKITDYLLDVELFWVRLSLLIFATLSFVLVFFLLKKEEYFIKGRYWKGVIRFFLRIIFILLIISSLFLIIGNVILGKMILVGCVGMILVSIALYIGYLLLTAIVRISLANESIRKSNVIKNHGEVIYKGFKNIFGIVLFINWMRISLENFSIKNEVIVVLKNIFTYQIKLGATSVGLNNIVAFVVAIYLSIWISRAILVILNEEVFPRSSIDKGVSSTITLLLRYSIISLGFLFALAVAGIQLEKVSIVIGALGVGIGFGLQNIFNNLISGIILAFERPINIGDTIQVGDLTGVVKTIGFRSSTVRTYDGAEVIVPNGDIISNQMINWTLSDKRRRLKINLGVDFNSDPEEVLDILREVVKDHPGVVTDSAPIPRFLGFGESTLNFQLLFWIYDYGTGFGVETAVTVKLFNKLKEKGIKVPFPRRDIVIVSDNGIGDDE